MKYALILAADGRICSATFQQYTGKDAILVGALPEGDICDYRYVDGSFVYDPIEKPKRVTQSEKIAALEKTVEEQQALIDALLGG